MTSNRDWPCMTPDEYHQERIDHGGQVVARVKNGDDIYADTCEELYQKIADAGLQSHQVCIACITPVDVDGELFSITQMS